MHSSYGYAATGLALACAVLGASVADAKTKFSVLHTFAGGSSDGAGPNANLVRDADGNLYGTAGTGGAFGFGVVFKITSKGKESLLYSFMGSGDGAFPDAGLIRDTKGNLYGTTGDGGTTDHGTVFELSPSGKETILYSFQGGRDGDVPEARLLRDDEGNLYGTTTFGGASNGGIVFKVTPKGKETILHTFKGGQDDGLSPGAGLLMDSKGNLYGDAALQGKFDGGVVYEITAAGKENILWAFQGVEDGSTPEANLISDAMGNLYGTTYNGGENNGVVFEVTPNGKENVLFQFAPGKAGMHPDGALAMDKAGNLYGTTLLGGTHDSGVVFKLSGKGKETVLYTFTGGNDGDQPRDLIMDSAGNLYGTAAAGGEFNFGTVFKVTP